MAWQLTGNVSFKVDRLSKDWQPCALDCGYFVRFLILYIVKVEQALRPALNLIFYDFDYISSSFGLRIIVQIAFRPAPGPERGSSKRGCKEKSHAYVTTSFSHFFVQPYKIQTCSWYIIVLLFTWKEKL